MVAYVGGSGDATRACVEDSPILRTFASSWVILTNQSISFAAIRVVSCDVFIE